MNIILVCESVFPENKGGLERWISWLGQELSRFGHDVTYLNSMNINEIREGVIYESLGKKKWRYVKNGKRSIFQTIIFGIRLYFKLLGSQHHLIYATQAPILSIFFIKLAGFLRQRKQVLFVEWLEFWSKEYWRYYLGYFSGTLAFSIQESAAAIGDIKVCFTHKMHKQLTYYNSDTEVLKLPGIVMESQNLFPQKFSKQNDITFLSRFIDDKQPFLAIDSVLKFRQSGWNGKFFVIGTGPLEDQIYQYILSLGAQEYIKLLVGIPDSEVKLKLSSSFVFLHTSKREGFGLSIVEAALQGIPSILLNYSANLSTELGIVPELICHQLDAEGVANKLQNAYRNQELYFEKLQVWLDEKYPLLLASQSSLKINQRINELFR
jgi:glycosyltransferase involved in cell wall biosynthesis